MTLNFNIVACENSGAQGTRKLYNNNNMDNNAMNGKIIEEFATVQCDQGQ